MEWESAASVTHTLLFFPQDLEMMTSWVGGVEEAVALPTEGGVEAWDASETDLLVEARQTSENLPTVSQIYSF